MVKTIEKVTQEDYDSARNIIEKYKVQRRQEISEEQKNCNHKDFYRREYDEDQLRTTCRKCFYEWDEKFDPNKINDPSLLCSGKFGMTDKDRENWRKYIKRFNCVED